MPIYIAIFCVLPLLAGLIPEYLVCRFTRRKWWKVLPPLAVAAITALVTAGRLSVWESDVSPVTQLLFVPAVEPPGGQGQEGRLMYLHLGQGVVVPYRDVLGVFDLDNTSSSRVTRAFLEGAVPPSNRVPSRPAVSRWTRR